MKKLIPICIFSCILTACNTKKENTGHEPMTNIDVNESNELLGTWKLIYGDIQEGDSLSIKDLSNTDFIKIINETHFAFFNQNIDDSSNFYGGGGTYTLDGTNYTETLNLTSVTSIRGHAFPFTVEIKGDTLIQQGLEEVKEANIKRYITEKYVRIEK